MDAEPEPTRGSAPRLGCAIAFVVGLAALVLVALSRGWIQWSAGQSPRTSPELAALEVELRAHYVAPELTVEDRRQIDIEGSILQVGVLNAPFLEGLEFGTQASLEQAFRVAIHTRNALPPSALYDHYEVVLTRRGPGIIARTEWRTYRFEAVDLPPR